MLWASVTDAFFFSMRSGEYAQHDGQPPDLLKILLGEDIELGGGEEGEPEWMTVRIRGSKTDQYSLGCVRSHSRSKDPTLCPVLATAAVQRLFPQRKRGGSESHLPFFRFSSGACVLRSLIQAWLARAALGVGLPGARFGSHSLRIGGATAMYAICQDVELVKRFGRWISSSFSLYLWERKDATVDLANQMVQTSGTLQLSHGLGAEVAAKQQEKRRVRFLLPGGTE